MCVCHKDDRANLNDNNMATKKIIEKTDMLVCFDYLTISIYALRIGKNSKEWRIAYGLVTPAPDKMPNPIATCSTLFQER